MPNTLTSQERAFNVLVQFPDGITAPDFEALLDTPEDKRSASARLSQFVEEGVASKRQSGVIGKTGRELVLYTPTGIPFAERKIFNRPKSRQRKRPTDTELIELRKWKVEAIRRFPELGTPSHVLAAREQVAAIYRAENNDAKAAMVAAGELDDGEAMRVVIALLAPRKGGAA